MKVHYRLFASIVLLVSSATLAQTSDTMKDMDMSKSMKMNNKGNASSMTEGEVKSVDQATGTITLKHADIENMRMPAMTMAFPVQDKAILRQFKQGDKVKFIVESVKNRAVITKIETAK